MRIARLAFAAFALSLAAPTVAQEVTTQVYELPKGARVHDVATAPDGSIWYTAQRQGALGILDPKTRRTRGTARLSGKPSR